MKQETASPIPDNLQYHVLWKRFQQGEASAFYSLYDQYADQLYNYGIRITRDSTLVEDCIHDLFVALWEKRQRLSAIHSFKYYSYAALRRRIFRALQQQRKLLSQTAYQFPLQASTSAEAQMLAREASQEQAQKLQQAIDALSARQREVIFLRYFDNFSYEEIALIMSISIDSVYKLVCKAIKAIKKHLTELSLLMWAWLMIC